MNKLYRLLPLLLLLLALAPAARAQDSPASQRSGNTLPTFCVNTRVTFNLLTTDGANAPGLYRCNGSTFAPVGGGAAVNATNGVIPYRSSSAAFSDSPLSVSGGNVSSSGTVTAPSFTASGTGGAGYASLPAQASNPSTPASGFTLFANSAGKLSFKRSDGFVRTFDAGSVAADITWTMPSTTATIARTDAAQSFTGNQTFSTSFQISGVTFQPASTGFSAVSGVGRFGYVNDAFQLSADQQFGWQSGNFAAGSPDTGLKRAKTKVIGLTDGGSGGGTFRAVATSPAQITADQNNYDPGGSSYFIRLTSDAARTLTGLSISQVDGETHYVWNVGAQNIVLANESASSTAANRFTTSTGADLTVGANKVALVMYDATAARWRAALLP